MSASTYYGKDYKPCMPTMDKHLFHQAEGISTFEWKTLIALHEAYCSLRFQWEPFKANASHPDRWGEEYARCRKNIADLLVDAIHEIEARMEVRSKTLERQVDELIRTIPTMGQPKPQAIPGFGGAR